MESEEMGRLVALIATWAMANARVRGGSEADRDLFMAYAEHTLSELIDIATLVGEPQGVSESDLQNECRSVLATAGIRMGGESCH
jgi:hypothetical protein